MTDRYDKAAVIIQTRQRVRHAYESFVLHRLAWRVQAHYAQYATGLAVPDAQLDAMQPGAVKRLSGTLWKMSRKLPMYNERNVWIEDLQMKYTGRYGELKSIDLAQADQLLTVSQDRCEFVILMLGGEKHQFRSGSREQYTYWIDGLKQYLGLAQAYYSLL
mmetsp:Transcript_34050/g.56379  ORF Transcript_34050/g.56379 Transcript_34050/m.56379 type:complete len:161 (+) Transcript_34050:108-590(+)